MDALTEMAWRKVEEATGQKFLKNSEPAPKTESQDDRVWFRTAETKIDEDCRFCKSCTDCNWEVRGSGFGDTWKPLCKECAVWLLVAHGAISKEDLDGQ